MFLEIEEMEKVRHLPLELQARVHSYYASPERTPAARSDIPRAARLFYRRHLQQRCRQAVQRRLSARLNRFTAASNVR